MFFWAALARRAKRINAPLVWLCFISVQVLLFVPTAYAQVKTRPFAMFARVHGGPDFEVFNEIDFTEYLSVFETGDGYIHSIDILEKKIIVSEKETEENDLIGGGLYAVLIQGAEQPPAYDADYLFCVTPDYIYYADAKAELALSARDIPAWVLNEADYYELFDYLSIANGYFTGILFPVTATMFVFYAAGQGIFYWTIAWMFGQTRRVNTYMTLWERFTVCVYASVPAIVPGLLAGIVLPVFNIIIFEVIVLYVTFKILGEW